MRERDPRAAVRRQRTDRAEAHAKSVAMREAAQAQRAGTPWAIAHQHQKLGDESRAEARLEAAERELAEAKADLAEKRKLAEEVREAHAAAEAARATAAAPALAEKLDTDPAES